MKKFLALLAAVSLSAQRIMGEKFCEKSSLADVDFICGESKPIPFQPCTDFSLVYGSATTATTLWFLGEKHSRYPSTLQCIDSLTENAGNHTIYLEGVESGETHSCLVFRGLAEKPGRTCKGWDDMDSHRKQGSLMIGFNEDTERRLLIRQKIAGLKNTYKSEAQFKRKIQQMKTEASNPQQTDLITLATIDWILEQTKQGNSYQAALDTPFPLQDPTGYDIKQSDLSKYRMFTENRDRSLQKTVRKHPTHSIGVVVAGRDHFIGKKEIEKLADKNPFAVLAHSG